MRIRSQRQLYFKIQSEITRPEDELQGMSIRLESLPGYNNILSKVLADLIPSGRSKQTGRSGMTAEQVLKALIVQMRKGYSYRELAHATRDSLSVREFLKIPPFSKGFHYKTLQANIKLIEEETLDLLGAELKSFALFQGIEDGKNIRTDGFNTQVNIHYPTDWSLMHDSIRVLSRIMCYTHEDLQVPIKFVNHYRASKKKTFKIHNDKSHKRRRRLNIELIRLTRRTLGYSRQALLVMENYKSCKTTQEQLYLGSLIADLKRFLPLVENVINQAHRRIVKGEKVSSKEKIVSIFEEHTDIIYKGSRNVIFGHKSTITTGKSGLILDIDIHDGNPADATLVKGVIGRHEQIYGAVPNGAVFDGCYSSNDNRDFAEKVGIQNVCFSKETDELSSCSPSMRKKLRNFRAGIEATVSMLMRMFGLTRVMNKGFRSFRTTVKAAVVTYNLFILSRIPLRT